VVRAFEVVQVLEGDLLEDGVDGLRVEALADVLKRRSIDTKLIHREILSRNGQDTRNQARAPISAGSRKNIGLSRIKGHGG
ncbi:MAG: hypothetical protein JW839_16945, partial [Candidatus Lokiarchaeota archaeon]|nr:hypothetical protein [Candidatus Lokiarchaeota archaeon]